MQQATAHDNLMHVFPLCGWCDFCHVGDGVHVQAPGRHICLLCGGGIFTDGPVCGGGRFVGGLSGLHTFFTSTNRTTYEHFRTRVNGQGNPYDVGFFRNWAQVTSAQPPVPNTCK